MLADYHVHTEFSDDSVYPMEQVIKDAIAMKMNEICFTDHGIMESKRTGTADIPLHTVGKNRLRMWITRGILQK